MKKHLNLIFSLLILTALLILPYFVFAQTDSSSETSPMAAKLKAVAGGGGYSTLDPNLFSIIGLVISAILGLLGVIFVILIVYAGFEWMTAAGNETKIEKATATIKHSVIGLVIVLSSWAIWDFILWGLIWTK